MIALLLIILFFSLKFWTLNYSNDLQIEEKSFYIAIGIPIVTSISLWIEGRIRAIINSTNVLTKKKKGGVPNEKTIRKFTRIPSF